MSRKKKSGKKSRRQECAKNQHGVPYRRLENLHADSGFGKMHHLPSVCDFLSRRRNTMAPDLGKVEFDL